MFLYFLLIIILFKLHFFFFNWTCTFLELLTVYPGWKDKRLESFKPLINKIKNVILPLFEKIPCGASGKRVIDLHKGGKQTSQSRFFVTKVTDIHWSGDIFFQNKSTWKICKGYSTRQHRTKVSCKSESWSCFSCNASSCSHILTAVCSRYCRSSHIQVSQAQATTFLSTL